MERKKKQMLGKKDKFVLTASILKERRRAWEVKQAQIVALALKGYSDTHIRAILSVKQRDIDKALSDVGGEKMRQLLWQWNNTYLFDEIGGMEFEDFVAYGYENYKRLLMERQVV